MTFKLKYYAPRLKPTDYTPLSEDHEKIIGLLKLLQKKHKITHEVEDISAGDVSIPAEMIRERRVYEHEFVPQARRLKKNVGVGLSKSLKKDRFLRLSGTIAIAHNGEIGWYATPCKEFEDYDDDFRIGFLKMLLDKGPRLLSKLCPPGHLDDSENKILNRFIDSGTLKGNFEKNVKVGYWRITKEANSHFMPEFDRFRNAQDNRRLLPKLKRIDAVCSMKNTAWVLEVEEKLNETALGQALVYRQLFSEDHPPENFPKLKIKAGIVCEISKPWIRDICREYDVEVFVV